MVLWKVYSVESLWLAERLTGQPEGRLRSQNKPLQVPALASHFVEDIAVGAEHVLVLTSSGEVWGWGNNAEGQLGLGNNITQRQPVVLPDLRGKNIRQISAGRNHSAAWTAPVPAARIPGTPLPLQLGHPTTIPPQFPAIKDVDTEAVRARLRVLYHFSDLISSSWRLMNLMPDEVWACISFDLFLNLSTLWVLWRKKSERLGLACRFLCSLASASKPEAKRQGNNRQRKNVNSRHIHKKVLFVMDNPN